eukprot:scaffold385833_cov22-Prasinocladus_malaysianus.AAC.1
MYSDPYSVRAGRAVRASSVPLVRVATRIASDYLYLSLLKAVSANSVPYRYIRSRRVPEHELCAGGKG